MGPGTWSTLRYRAGVDRIVAQSISWVYPTGTEPATETDPLDFQAGEPRRTTVTAVRELEAAVQEVDAGVVLRFGQLYGPGTWYTSDGRFGEAARAGLLPATETVTSFLHVDDAAAAIVAALAWPAGVWNVVDDEPAPGTAWVLALAAAVGAPAPDTEQVGDPGARCRTALSASWVSRPAGRPGARASPASNHVR